MKQKRTYYFAILFAGILLAACTSGNYKLPPLDESYALKDRNPFGAYVLHQQLQHFYNQNTIRTIKRNFETTWAEMDDTSSVYINISKNLFLSTADRNAMLAYVADGNSLFVSSNYIDEALLDTLGCKVSGSFQLPGFAEMKYTSVRMAANLFLDSAVYQYFYVPFYNHFSGFDTLHSKVLGNNNWAANFIVVFYGKGRFYLHTDPRAFSNYFLLQQNNYRYFQQVFSFTKPVPQNVYWDDYYNKRNYPVHKPNQKSGLAVLLQYPAMAWAFWLLISLFGLYILFGSKRKQRIVDAIAPNTNTTVAFTETISRLYLQNKDNRNIADKMVMYLLEQARNKYYLDTSQLNDYLVSTLSRKSNNSKEGTQKLFKLIATIQQSMEVSDQQLLLLNQQIEQFYKKQL